MNSLQKKIMDMYLKKKYSFDLGSFYSFLNQKSKFDSFQIQLVRQKISQFNIQWKFQQPMFLLLLRLMTAVQQFGQNVRNMKRQSINQIPGNFDFKGKKSSQVIKVQQKSQINQDKLQTQQKNKPKVNMKQQNKQQQKPKQQQKVRQNIKQPRQMKQQKPQRRQQRLEKKQSKPLETIKQVQNSSEINYIPKNEQQNAKNLKNNNMKQKNIKQRQGPKYLDMNESQDNSNKAYITGYQKFTQDYLNIVIKYKIEYKNNKVQRRFSQFEKLLNKLKQKYQGYILPKLPPKQGIKAGMTYIYGIDQKFLQQRKCKLEYMINRLLSNQFVNQDKTLNSFLTDPNYQIQVKQQGYGSYIKAITDIVFNAKEIKDYGVAYYNYLTQKKNAIKLNSQIQNKYNQINQVNSVFALLNNYRNKINANFDSRRSLIHQLQIHSRQPTNSKFDALMDSIQQQIQDLNLQIENYKQLKSQQSWIHQLINQKRGDTPKILHQLNQDKKKLQNRISQIQNHLLLSLQQFHNNKIQQLQLINSQIITWRQNVHP